MTRIHSASSCKDKIWHSIKAAQFDLCQTVTRNVVLWKHKSLRRDGIYVIQCCKETRKTKFELHSSINKSEMKLSAMFASFIYNNQAKPCMPYLFDIKKNFPCIYFPPRQSGRESVFSTDIIKSITNPKICLYLRIMYAMEHWGILNVLLSFPFQITVLGLNRYWLAFGAGAICGKVEAASFLQKNFCYTFSAFCFLHRDRLLLFLVKHTR